jgi:hypothetical protein
MKFGDSSLVYQLSQGIQDEILFVIELIQVADWICAGVEFALDAIRCYKASMAERKQVVCDQLGAKEAFVRGSWDAVLRRWKGVVLAGCVGVSVSPE